VSGGVRKPMCGSRFGDWGCSEGGVDVGVVAEGAGADGREEGKCSASSLGQSVTSLCRSGIDAVVRLYKLGICELNTTTICPLLLTGWERSIYAVTSSSW